MLRGWSARKHAFGTALLSGMAWLLPILPRWPHLVVANLHILTHRGDYGTGGAGLPAPATLWQNMVLDNFYAPEMLLSLELFALVLIAARWRKRALPFQFQRGLVVCGAIVAATMFLVAKQPRETYFVPAYAFAALGVALIVHVVLEYLPRRRLVAGAVGLLLAIKAVYAQELHTSHENDNWRADQQVMAKAFEGGCLVVPYYFVDWQVWDLYFAVAYDHRFAARLARLYPDFIAYDVGEHRFADFAGPLSPLQASRRFAREKCVRLWGVPWQTGFGLSPDTLTLIQRSHYHAVYALKAVPQD